MTTEKVNVGTPGHCDHGQISQADKLARLERQVWSRDQLISSLQEQLKVASEENSLQGFHMIKIQDAQASLLIKYDHALQDVARLDFLESTTKGYGLGWILRDSTTGRGMRLHETSLPEASPTVREAIDAVMKGDENATV